MIQQAKLGKVRGAILIVLGIVMGAILLEPAVAHLGSFQHLNKHYLTRGTGAVNNTQINDFTTGSFTNILAKSINAPSKGVLVINASVSAEDDCSLPGENVLLVRLRVDGTPVTSNEFAYELTSDCTTTNKSDAASLDAAVTVGKGTHNIQLQAREAGAGSFIFGRSLTAVFLPTGSGVSIPVPVAPSGPSSQNHS